MRSSFALIFGFAPIPYWGWLIVYSYVIWDNMIEFELEN